MSLEKDVTQIKEDIFKTATPKQIQKRRAALPKEMLLSSMEDYTEMVERTHEKLEEADQEYNLGDFQGVVPQEFQKLFFRRGNLAAQKMADIMYEMEELVEEMNHYISDHMQEMEEHEGSHIRGHRV